MTFKKQVQLPKRRVVLEHREMKIKYSKLKAEAVSYIISGCICSSRCADKTKGVLSAGTASSASHAE